MSLDKLKSLGFIMSDWDDNTYVLDHHNGFAQIIDINECTLQTLLVGVWDSPVCHFLDIDDAIDVLLDDDYDDDLTICRCANPSVQDVIDYGGSVNRMKRMMHDLAPDRFNAPVDR